MKEGIYVLRNERTNEWPYSIAIAVAGPFDNLRKAEDAFHAYEMGAGHGEIKLRRWNGEKWTTTNTGDSSGIGMPAQVSK